MTAYLAAIILTPAIFGAFALAGSISLSEDHTVLKIFLYLLSLVSVVGTLFLGGVILEYKDAAADVASEAIADTTYWIGIIIGVIIMYFLIYLIAKAFHTAAQNKEERLQY